MANTWYRMYNEFASDPKVQMLSEAMQRRLVMIFCLRSGNVLETLQETEIAFHLRLTMEELDETKAVFIQKDFIDEEWNITNWNKRQYISDSSTERVRKYRQGKKQYETFQKQGETVTVTVPEQIQNKTEQTIALDKQAPFRCNFAAIWNANCDQLPKITSVGKTRTGHLKARVLQGVTDEIFLKAVKACTTKPHLRGENDRGWTATFDWLIENDNNLNKAIENSYGLKNGFNSSKPALVFTDPGSFNV